MNVRPRFVNLSDGECKLRILDEMFGAFKTSKNRDAAEETFRRIHFRVTIETLEHSLTHILLIDRKR